MHFCLFLLVRYLLTYLTSGYLKFRILNHFQTLGHLSSLYGLRNYRIKAVLDGGIWQKRKTPHFHERNLQPSFWCLSIIMYIINSLGKLWSLNVSLIMTSQNRINTSAHNNLLSSSTFYKDKVNDRNTSYWKPPK